MVNMSIGVPEDVKRRYSVPALRKRTSWSANQPVEVVASCIVMIARNHLPPPTVDRSHSLTHPTTRHFGWMSRTLARLRKVAVVHKDLPDRHRNDSGHWHLDSWLPFCHDLNSRPGISNGLQSGK